MTESTQRAVRKHRLFNANAPAGPAAGVLESTKHRPLHRFAVKTLPRCASALSAGFPPRILPARTNKKGRRCASAPSAPRLLCLRPPPVFDLENYFVTERFEKSLSLYLLAGTLVRIHIHSLRK